MGKRAKDIDKGVLVVRFELPFNIWCDTCGVSEPGVDGTRLPQQCDVKYGN